MKKWTLRIVIFVFTVMLFSKHFGFGLFSPGLDITFTELDDTLILNGETQDDSLMKFKQALARHPNTKRIVLNVVSGSDADDINIKIAKFIRKKKLATHLTSTSVIESGGIELFLGGVDRTMERGAQIGVHSWSDRDGYEGRDLPENHPDHKLYIKAYTKLGIPKSFYWFTLNAAAANDMYYLSEDEIERFNLLTAPIRDTRM